MRARPISAGSGLAAVISTGDDGYKDLSFGPAAARSVWTDMTGNLADTVTLSENGAGRFPVKGGSVSVWIRAALTE